MTLAEILPLYSPDKRFHGKSACYHTCVLEGRQWEHALVAKGVVCDIDCSFVRNIYLYSERSHRSSYKSIVRELDIIQHSGNDYLARTVQRT